MSDKLFKNTHLFSPAASHWEKHQCYTPYPSGTQGYFDFWDTEVDRCLNGYTVGDVTITGYHYFYLNYCRMNRVIDRTLEDGTILSERFESFPRFYDEDHYYFSKADEARRTGKHMVVLKARRKGFSYKAAAMMCRNYFLVRKSKNFVFAGLKEHLEGVDAILTKTWDIMNFVDDNTAWTQPRSINQPMTKKSGYRKKVKGTFVDMGFQSSIAGISLKDNPDKVRGKAGELIFYEEAGDLTELLAAWNRAMPTMKQGNRTLGLMTAFGTGGTEGTGFEGLDELFYHPEAYDVLEFDNIWSESGHGTKCGYFCPIYKILEGFIDDEGNSLDEKAKAFEMGEREKKRMGADPKSYDSYLAENPFTPEEATLQVSSNMFNLALIKAQLDRVKVHNLQNLGTPGELHPTPDGGVKFKMNPNLKPVYQFPHRKGDDIRGCIVVYEVPFKQNGVIPSFLYFICHDPYGQDKSQGNSLGAAYVIKRVNNVSQPDDMIVASYVGRPATQDDYNRNLFLLSQYYNAKIGFENDRGDVIGFAKRFRKLHYLQPEFEMLHNKELQSQNVNRGYGMHMTTNRKLQGEIYSRDWQESPRSKNMQGDFTLNINKVYDPGLLNEWMKFNQKGNFDRAMAMMIGMFHMKEMFNSVVRDSSMDRSSDAWFDAQYNGLPVDLVTDQFISDNEDGYTHG